MLVVRDDEHGWERRGSGVGAVGGTAASGGKGAGITRDSVATPCLATRGPRALWPEAVSSPRSPHCWNSSDRG